MCIFHVEQTFHQTMFELLSLFIRATRLDQLAKYFFVFDLQNYGCLTPVYLSQTYQLKSENPDSWHILEQNISVNKTKVPFSAIGLRIGTRGKRSSLCDDFEN